MLIDKMLKMFFFLQINKKKKTVSSSPCPSLLQLVGTISKTRSFVSLSPATRRKQPPKHGEGGRETRIL